MAGSLASASGASSGGASADGVAAAGSVVALVHFFLQGYVAQMLQTIAIVTIDDALIVAPVLVGIGVLFAGVAAAVAIRRYLKI